MKILLIDAVVATFAFAFAVKFGANIAIALSCGFMAASIVNLIGASINISRIGRLYRGKPGNQ